jgi:hypothetical protein
MKCANCNSILTKKGKRNDLQRWICRSCGKWTTEQAQSVKRVIVTPDKHFPLHDEKAINVLCKAIEIVQPDAYVDLGDLFEGESVSHWQWKKKKRPPLEYQIPVIDREIQEASRGIDQIDEALERAGVKEKHITVGNHDKWFDYFVDENPYLSHYRFENIISDRGYKVTKCGDILKMGKLHFYHGHHFAGINHTRNHLLRYGCNLMYGHHHDIQQSSVTHVDGTKSAWSIGCLKDMSSDNNSWLGGRKHNWSHGFAIVDFFDKGYFNVQPIVIQNGRTSLWGRMIQG